MNTILLIQVFQHLLSVFSFFLGIYLVSDLIRERKAPGSTWGWLLTMTLVPYLGVPLYITLGGRKLRNKAYQKQGLYHAIPYDKTPTELLPLERILLSSGAPKKTTDNKIQILASGQQAYSEILRLISGAKTNIWITTYILGNDAIGIEILSTLTKQAKKGVEVCLLLDGIGSFWVSRFRLRQFKKAGGKIAFFLPLLHIPFFGHSNLRNHRKIMIVDEKFAISGGMNLAQEYLSPASNYWIDLCFLIQGSGVQDLSSIFQSDWCFASKEPLTKKSDQSPLLDTQKNTQSALLQVIASGPDVSGDPLYDSILSAIFSAQKRIWIATPYFIPDDALAKALELACRRGIDVRLIIPKKSNHLLADICRGSYLKQLDLVGGQLYFDLHPMMHAKVTLIDDSYAVVGSANIDMRSLLLNYEVGLFLYSNKDINTIADWFLHLQQQAEKGLLKKTLFADFSDGLGRILGPML